MSLYNIVHGVNEIALPLLNMLNLTAKSVGRFRDCFLQRDGEGLEIHVYTRNGGGNRDDYAAVTDALRAHALYLRDFDDAMDSTYATYVFSVPKEHSAVLTAAVASNPELIPAPPGVRFKAFMDKLQTDPNDPDVLRVKATLQPAIDNIVAMTEAGSGPVGLLDDEDPAGRVSIRTAQDSNVNAANSTTKR